MVRPVIPHIAGIVVGYWRNRCSYRNIAREAGLHSNTVYGIIKRFRERGNFVCGRRTRRPRKTNDRDDRVLYRLARESRRFSVQRLRRAWQPNVNFAVYRQTVNRRLVARAYRARRMVKVPRLTVRAKLVRRHWAQKHINRPLGQWQHVIFCDESRFMLFRVDNRIRVRRLVGEAMNEDCTNGNVYKDCTNGIGRGLEELDLQSVNLRQLGVVVQHLRQQIPLERVQTLVNSMPRRVRAQVDPRGSSTQYWTVDTLGLTSRWLVVNISSTAIKTSVPE